MMCVNIKMPLRPFKKGGTMMYPISKEYLVLFNAITDAEKALQLLNEELVRAQQTAEELYIGGEAGAADEMAETPA